MTRLSVENRWRNGKGYKNQNLIYRAIIKYGWDNIKHEILFENLTKEEAEQKEIELIAFYKSNQKEFGYNIENGGNCKGKMSEAERQKRSILFKGENNPMYGKIGLRGEKNPMYGKKWTDEQKKAHSEKIKGKLAGEKNPMYGKKHTEEFKKNFDNNAINQIANELLMKKLLDFLRQNNTEQNNKCLIIFLWILQLRMSWWQSSWWRKTQSWRRCRCITLARRGRRITR